MTKDEALDLALEALSTAHIVVEDDMLADEIHQAITAIKQVRSAPVQKRPQNCGTGYCSCVECVMEPAPVHPVAIPDCGEAGHADGACGTRECLPSFRRAPPPAQPAPVQVSPLEFVTMVMEKEHLVGKPLFWAEWPNKEKNT